MQRNSFLFNILCILSLLSAIGGTLYGLIMPVINNIPRSEIIEMYETYNFAYTSEAIDMVYSLASMGFYYALFNVVQILAIVFLLVRRKEGFHIYAASLIGQVGVMIIAVGFMQSFTYLFWNLLWIFIFLRLVNKEFSPKQ